MKINFSVHITLFSLVVSGLYSAGLANAQSDTDSYNANGTTFRYDQTEHGASLDIQDARGVLTRYVYNNRGLMIEEQSAERGTTSYEYDAIGNVIKIIRAGNLVTLRSFDEQNRLIREVMKKNNVDRKVNRYSYDDCAGGEGRLCKVISDGHVTKYAYNEAGAFTKIATKYAGEDSFEVTRYSYDEKGRPNKLQYPTGLTVQYYYSEDDYVSKITGRYGNGEDRESFVIAKNIRFDSVSNQLSSLKFDNGLKTKFIYGEDKRLQNIKTLRHGIPIDNATYSRDEVGNITHVRRLNPAKNRQYSYDGLGRLLLETKGTDLATQSSTSYSYDAVGNRITYDNGNNQKAYTYAPQANRLDEINRKILSYDVRGNLLNDRKGKKAFTYDVTNRMTAFYKNDDLRASYDYNAFGQRISKTLHRPQRDDDSYQSLHFAYTPDGWLLSEWGRRNDKKRSFANDYVWLGDRPIAQIERKIRPDGTTRKARLSFLHTDHLNTPRWATDIEGKTIWRWESDAFGKGKAERDPDGDGQKTAISLRFPGQYYDHESGLYYNHHRDYDPAKGRYIQSDPIGLNGGINRYAYVGGNPISYIDPRGLSRTAQLRECEVTVIIDSDGNEIPGSAIRTCSGGSNIGPAIGGGYGGTGIYGIGSSVPGFSPTGGGDWTQYAQVGTTTTTSTPSSVCTPEMNLLANEMRAALSDTRVAQNELGGVIYRTSTGTLGASPPVIGSFNSVDIYSATVPSGATIIGGWHTHPTGSYVGTDGYIYQAGQYFSEQDLSIANPEWIGRDGAGSPVYSRSRLGFLGLGLAVNTSRRSGLFFLRDSAINTATYSWNPSTIMSYADDISKCG